MVFLALLAIAIGVLLALSLVLIGLLEAPWPVLLVGLLVALYGLQRVLGDGQDMPLGEMDLSDPSPPLTTPKSGGKEAPPGDQNELLTYRGIRYQVAKSPEPSHPDHDPETLVEGIYRGQHWQRWRTQPSDNPEATSESAEITYRGHKVIRPEKES